MAERKISTKVAIEGEDQYQQSVQKITRELKTLQSSLKEVQSRFQDSANGLEALTAKQQALEAVQKKQEEQVRKISDAYKNAQDAVAMYRQNAADLEEKLRANSEALEKLKDATGDTAEEEQRLAEEAKQLAAAQEENNKKLEAAEAGVTKWEGKLATAQTTLNNTNAEIKKNDQYLEEAKTSADGCATSIDQYGNKVKDAGTSTGQMNDALGALASALVASGLKRGFEELVETLGKCVEVAGQFEYAMAGVAAISGANDQELAQLTETAKEYAASSVFTAQQVASAYNYMAMAGWDASAMLSGLPGIMSLAAASGEELGTVCDIVTDALTAFGLESQDAAHFSDVLAKAAASSNTNVGLMGASFKMVATTAGALNYSIDDVAVALGTMANSGLKGEMAGTALATAFTRMSGTNENATKAMKDLNIQMFESDGSARELSDVLNDLRDAFSTLTDKEKESYAYQLAGQKGMKGLLAIVNASTTDWNALTESIQNCNGAAQEMSDIKLDTYEGQVKLLESAMEALEIAVGDKLLPVLGSFAEKGADALAWAADFVNKNEAVVPIIGALTAGMGALTIAVAGYTVAKRLAIPVIKAFNEAVKANPVGLYVTAITTAIAAVSALVLLLPDAENEYVAIAEAARDVADAIEESNKAYEETTAAIEDNYATVDELVSKLAELSEKENKSAADMELMHSIIDQLNEKVPGLDLSFDSLNGTLSMTADQIREVAKAQAEAQQYEANVQKLIDAENARTDALEVQKEAAEKLAEAQEALNEAEAKSNDITYGASVAYSVLSSEVFAAQQAYDTATQAVEDADTAYKEAEEAINAYAEAHGAAAEASDEMADAAGEVSNALGILAEDYLDAKEKASDSINSQIGLFDEFAAKVNEDLDSTDEMIDRWNTQTQNMAMYTENLRKAAVYGIDEGIVKSLADGSSESAGYLAAIIQSVEDAGGSLEGMGPEAEEAVAKFNAAFRETANARNDLAVTVAAMETDYQTAMNAIKEASDNVDFSGVTYNLETTMLTATEKATEGGENIAAGVAEGVSTNEHLATDAIKHVGDQMNVDFTQLMGIKSPSTVFKGHGENIDLGLAQGITDNTAKVVAAMTSMTDTLTRRTEQQLTALKTRMVEIISALPGAFETTGEQTAQGFVDGFYSRSGSIYYAVENVVDTAIARARRAAATASPSKKTTKIGEDISEGLAVGIWNKNADVAAATQKVVEAAMQIDAKQASASLAQSLNAAIGTTLKASNTKYSAGVDYSALMENANSMNEFIELASMREAKILGENIDLVANGWKTTEQFLEDWLQKNEISVEEAGNQLARYAADMKKAMKDVSEDVKYTADTDYSALMQEADSLSAFLDLAAQRTAKVLGENIDLAANGWKTNAEFLDEWLKKSGASVQGLSEDILKYADVFRAAAYETSDALEYAADTDYHALMLQADSFEEFVRLASLRNAKIVGQGIDLLAEGWKSNSEILEEWLKKSELAIESTDKKTKDADKGLGEVLGEVEDLTKEIDRLIGGLPRQFTNIGEQMIKGMITGLHRYEDGLYFKIQQIVNNAIAAAKEAAGVASPSRKMKEIFQYMGDGAVLGLKNREEAVADEMEHLMSRALGAAAGTVGLPEIGPINDRMPRLPEYGEGYGGIAAAIENAFAGVRPAGGDSNITFTLEIPLDGQTLARKTYTYFQREGSRLGGNLVEVAG